MQHKRTKVWIDRFQTLLSWRIAFYFLFYQAAVWAIVVIDANLSRGLANVIGPEFASKITWCLVGVMVAVGFLFIYDAVLLAHRIVGPLVAFGGLRIERTGAEAAWRRARECL